MNHVSQSICRAIGSGDYGDYEEYFKIGNWSYWKIGGSARFFVWPRTPDQLVNFTRLLRDSGQKYMVVGKASNLLFSSSHIESVFIGLDRHLTAINIDNHLVTVQAGMPVPQLAFFLGRRGLVGIEHTAGIPGTIGGLVTMNGGSLRNSISSNIIAVTSIDECGRLTTRAASECDFKYRNSVFKKRSDIILEVKLRLENGDPKESIKLMRNILSTRRNKFPLNLPNCGSVFISDPELYGKWGPPGKIIEECGLKGYRLGGVQVSEYHANFIVNNANGTSGDVLILIKHIRNEVWKKTGIWPRTEPLYVDDQGDLWDIADYLTTTHLE